MEAQRIAERTNFDVEMMRETGFCSGIENYSRHLTGLESRGSRPARFWTTSRRISLLSLTSPILRFPRCEGCILATGPGRKLWWIMGSVCRRHWITVRLNFEEFESHIRPDDVCIRHAIRI